MVRETVEDSTIDLDGAAVEVHVWLTEGTTAAARAAVARFAVDAVAFDRLARRAMRDDWDAADSAVRDYLEHHRDDLDDEQRDAALGGADLDADAFVQRLRLVRIGLHPDAPRHVAIFDYCTDREVTDNLVAVKFDAHNAVAEIAMES